jgi:cytochrome P450
MTTLSARALEFDPLATHADPYPIYRRLRDEAPCTGTSSARVWSVSRFDDVMHVLKTPEVFSSRAMFTMIMAGGREKPPPLSLGVLRFSGKMIHAGALNPLEFFTARNLIAEDGERHASMRAIVNRGFTPRQIAGWEPRIARARRRMPRAAAARRAVRRGGRPRGAGSRHRDRRIARRARRTPRRLQALVRSHHPHDDGARPRPSALRRAPSMIP